MFFPLLEALLQKDAELCKSRVHEFMQTDEDITLLFKSLLTYASQHSITDSSVFDAVVVSDSLIHLTLNYSNETDQMKQEIIIGRAINFLCSVSVESLDSSILRPSSDGAKVVSVSDLEESFEQNDRNTMLLCVRDLLMLMDNKHYFMEIMYRIALARSPQSVILASATSRAIEIMGWQNNFTPFLIYHLIVKLFQDSYRFEFSEETAFGETVFEENLLLINSSEAALFMSSAFRMYKDCKVLANRLYPKIEQRIKSYFRSQESKKELSKTSVSEIAQIIFHSALDDLSSFHKCDILKSKFPFVV